MKKFLKPLIFIFFISASIQKIDAQVVLKEYLTSNHEGKIDKSKNNGGKPLYYKMEYKNTEGARINYTLNFYKDASMKTPWLSFPLLIRNLPRTLYLDVSMTKDNMTKVFALIFKKDLRWARVKYSPHEGCALVNPNIYDRIDMVDNYEALLNNTFSQMDRNVDLNCYAASK